jgi:L-asparaginase II
MKSRVPFVIDVLRGQAVESKHQVMAVVVDDRGMVVGFWGNADYVTYPRSAIKMLQALVMVESGAMEKFSLDEKMLAMACASHMGEKHHMDTLNQWMEKINLTETGLRCGPAYPGHEQSQFEMIRKGAKPSSVIHNCSGKHLGIISTCLAYGEDPKDYHLVNHKAQVRIRKMLSELMKVSLDSMPVGSDGCGIPTWGIPLQAVAVGASSFFSKEMPKARAQALDRILHAWRNNPRYVSGSENFSAALAEATKGRALLKSGAEGSFVGLLPDKGYAFALKVADGAKRAAEVAAALLFKQFGALTDQQYLELKAWTMPTIKNSRGEDVGTIRLGSSVI